MKVFPFFIKNVFKRRSEAFPVHHFLGGKSVPFMLYTNLETLIFPIATGFVAAFESHFVYKGTYFVYKKYFLKMQALPAFVCDLDPFWIQVFILHLFSYPL